MNEFILNLLNKKISAWILVVLGIIAFAVFIFCIAFFIGQFYQKRKFNFNIEERVKKEREDAIKKSKAVIGGRVGEQVAPFLPNFPCNPGDVRFVGKPIDFVGFPGATDGTPIKEVLLIEVKTGKSQLSQREKEIKEAVDNGKVRYVIYHADQN